VFELVEDVETPKKKRMRKNMSFAEKYEHFLQKSVVRGKVLKISYFQEQGLGLYLEKLEAQDWLDLFINTKRACSALDLDEFFANSVVTNGVVTSIVNGHKLRFNVKELGEILGMPPEGFDVYVHEDKSVLGTERLLELTQKISQKPNLTAPRSVRKGEITPMYRLLFWFIIKNVIP